MLLFVCRPGQERLGEDVATPSPLASSCRLPVRERSKHDRKRSHHRKSIGGTSELASVAFPVPEESEAHKDKKHKKKHKKDKPADKPQEQP